MLDQRGLEIGECYELLNGRVGRLVGISEDLTRVTIRFSSNDSAGAVVQLGVEMLTRKLVVNPHKVVKILYTNWKGETAWRNILPLAVPDKFQSSAWHPDWQWVMIAFDLDKKEERSFARKDIKEWVPNQVFETGGTE